MWYFRNVFLFYNKIAFELYAVERQQVILFPI